MTSTILWRRLDRPGHEAARLIETAGGWNLAGCAVFQYQEQAVRLDYMITCDKTWKTQFALVVGWIGDREIHCEITADAHGAWTLNGETVPGVAGCVDVDLNFSPSTNLLPIRRLNLAVGARETVRAAWLRFPSFALEPLEQTYIRTSDSRYRYESAGGRFTAEIDVDENGLPTNYPPAWQAE